MRKTFLLAAAISLACVSHAQPVIDTKDEQLDWTANKLKAAGIRYFLGAHCTGLNAVYRIREITGLSKTDCLVGAVGNTFDLDKGITTGWLR